jgi:hypothetical protein
MGILAAIGNFFIGIGEVIIGGIRSLLGLKKVPSDKIRAKLRQQWLELLPGEKDIPGVEYEGEVYFETPK